MNSSTDDKANVVKLVPIEKNKKDILNTVLTNTIKMLTNRGLLDKEDIDNNINKILESHSDDMLYIVPTNNKKYIIKIIQQNITTINKASGISDLLHKYNDNNIIIIVKSVSKKVLNEISLRYPNTEVFLEKEKMINIVDYDLVPEHQLLSNEDVQNFYELYNVKKSSMIKIYKSDPISKYYNAQVGDIFKIIRPSETSGIVNTYRLVINR